MFCARRNGRIIKHILHHYQRIEIGKGTPSLETFIDIIEILKISNDEAIILLKSFKRVFPILQ